MTVPKGNLSVQENKKKQRTEQQSANRNQPITSPISSSQRLEDIASPRYNQQKLSYQLRSKTGDNSQEPSSSFNLRPSYSVAGHTKTKSGSESIPTEGTEVSVPQVSTMRIPQLLQRLHKHSQGKP